MDLTFCKWVIKGDRLAQKSQSDLEHDPSKDEKNQGLLSSLAHFMLWGFPFQPLSCQPLPSMSLFILPALGRSSLTLSTRLLKLSEQLLTPSSSTQQAHSVLWDELWLTPFLSPLHPPYLPTYLSAALSYPYSPLPPSLSAEIKTTINNYIRHLNEPEEEWWEKIIILKNRNIIDMDKRVLAIISYLAYLAGLCQAFMMVTWKQKRFRIDQLRQSKAPFNSILPSIPFIRTL